MTRLSLSAPRRPIYVFASQPQQPNDIVQWKEPLRQWVSYPVSKVRVYHRVQRISEPVSSPFVHPVVKRAEERSLENTLTLHMLLKEPNVYFLSELPYCRVRLHPSRSVLWNIRSQEFMCQVQAEQQPPLAARRGGSLHNKIPIYLPANSDRFGYVADPLQSVPEVDGCVHAEDQEHIVGREG